MKTAILKFFARRLYRPEGIDAQKMRDWLWNAYSNDGFKQYYTMRKRQLVNILILEDNAIKRAETRGRLNELGALSANIAEEKKKREAATKK